MNEVRKEANIDNKDPIVVTANEYRGEPRLDIRTFWDGRPTKKGVNISFAEAWGLLNTIVEVVNEASPDRDVEIVLLEKEADSNIAMMRNGNLVELVGLPS